MSTPEDYGVNSNDPKWEEQLRRELGYDDLPIAPDTDNGYDKPAPIDAHTHEWDSFINPKAKKQEVIDVKDLDEKGNIIKPVAPTIKAYNNIDLKENWVDYPTVGKFNLDQSLLKTPFKGLLVGNLLVTIFKHTNGLYEVQIEEYPFLVTKVISTFPNWQLGAAIAEDILKYRKQYGYNAREVRSGFKTIEAFDEEMAKLYNLTSNQFLEMPF
jgi:hypothetical protein